MPFCYIIIKSNKPNKLPENPKTIGEHIFKIRQHRTLYQSEVATLIGVDETTIYNWEKGATQPTVRCLPRIYEFLGYVPEEPEPQTLAEKLMQYRRLNGISQKKLAAMLKIDPGTLAKWERGKGVPAGEMLERLATLIPGVRRFI